ncbi:MAG: DUF948 domain-containing protein [Chloroflexota bacterium]
MNTQTPSPQKSLPPSLTPREENQKRPSKNETWRKVALIAGGILILALIGGGLYFLFRPSTDTGRVRDIFIIFMALEFLVIGLALIILIVQLARLINLLQHEVKPILDSTNETARTLRGTTEFISDQLVEPIIKLNEYLAGLSKFFTIFRSKEK